MYHCSAQDTDSTGRDNKNELMIKTQIIARGITDTNVLNAMIKVERHKFVPVEHQNLAYNDTPLPIGEGQTISQPYVVALMTEKLDLDSSKRVLEIGTGSGYQAAILGEICNSVFSIEIIKVLGERAKDLLNDLGYSNVHIKIGDGYKGWEEYSPFDAIIVTCSPSHIPQPLKDQLAEGGKLIIPVGGMYNQELVLLVKKNNKIIKKEIIPVRFVPMIDKKGDKY